MTGNSVLYPFVFVSFGRFRRYVKRKRLRPVVTSFCGQEPRTICRRRSSQFSRARRSGQMSPGLGNAPPSSLWRTTDRTFLWFVWVGRLGATTAPRDTHNRRILCARFPSAPVADNDNKNKKQKRNDVNRWYHHFGPVVDRGRGFTRETRTRRTLTERRHVRMFYDRHSNRTCV